MGEEQASQHARELRSGGGGTSSSKIGDLEAYVHVGRERDARVQVGEDPNRRCPAPREHVSHRAERGVLTGEIKRMLHKLGCRTRAPKRQLAKVYRSDLGERHE